MHRLFLPVLALLLGPAAVAQQAAPWQQEVAYDMDIHLAADRHQLTGTQRLVYTNNSPDTLRQVFYHLYFNAFQPTSMMAERNRHLPDPDRRVVPRIFELGPDEIGWYDIRSLSQDGESVPFDVDDTVMRVDVRPIPPGASTTFEMTFRAQVPLQTRRSGRDSREGIDFTMTQWYPKMAAYDDIGWHADPYVGREFYAPFGTFDVRLTLPADYVVGATGVLQNPEAVGHGYDRAPGAGLASASPAPGPDGTPPDSLTWHFRAENVHDFAWTADPDYLHVQHLVSDVPGRAEPVRLHFLFQPDVAETWAALPEQTAELLRFFSAQYGPYAYPQFTVAQGGDGGMEYPMFTAITGRRSPRSLLGVTAHEFAHMWFYGMVATNENDFAWMDEGFTSFASHAGSAHVLSEGTAGPVSYAYVRERIATLQLLGLYERPNKPADWFDTNLAYGGASYTAGAALADLLGYVIGDAERDAFLREYVARYTFGHPYPADVMSVAQDVSGLQLDWLFEQFLTGAVRYDYGVDDLTAEPTADGVRSTIRLRRHEPGVLPVDVWLRYDHGTEEMVTVPLSVMEGHKPVPPDWTVAEPWAWTTPTYDLVVERPSRVVEAVVDPERRMLDLDPSNNRVLRGGPDVPREFAGFFRTPEPQRAALTYAVSPIALYAHDYGVGVGGQLRAALPNRRGSLQLGVTVWPEVVADEDRGFDDPGFEPAPGTPDFGLERDASPFDGIDYSAVYTRNRVLGPLDELRFSAEKHLGIMENRVAFTKVLGAYPVLRDWDHTLTLTLAHQNRTSDRAFEDFDPLVTFAEDDTFGADTGFDDAHVLSARLDYRVGDEASEIAAFLEVGGGLGESEFVSGDGAFNANRFHVTATKAGSVGPFTGLARFALGVGGEQLAPQKWFGLGAASVESRWRSDAYRVLVAAPDDPQDDFHFFAFSGVGPVAYLLGEPYLPVADEIVQRSPYPTTGTKLIAGTLALRSGLPRVPGLDPTWQALLAPLEFEVFSGFGSLSPGVHFSSDFVADAGIGVQYDVGALRLPRGLVAQSDVLSGLRLVAKFPVWASDPDQLGPDADAFAFRWLVGIETGL
jgi:hypothetical protein